MTDERFETDITIGIYNISKHYDNYVVLGDLNFDVLKDSKGSRLNNVCVVCLTLTI